MNLALPREAVTGVVLAGGRGSRMGSADKGLQLFQGRPLFIHATERLAPQVSTVLVNANRNTERYAESGLKVVADEPVTFAGPLAGFATGLKHCETPYLVTVPCDSPFFPTTLVEALGKALLREKADLAIAAAGHADDALPQPVFCLMRRDILPHLVAFLATGQRKIDAWYGSLNVARAHFADAAAFRNINTMAELEKVEAEAYNKR